MIFKRCAALVVVLLLAGCSSVDTIAPQLSLSEKEKQWQLHQQQLGGITSWRVVGRLGLTVPERSGSMSLEWQQQQQEYVIYLDGPFGQSVAEISGDNRQAMAKVSDGQEVVGSNPEELMLILTGWDFPVSSLRYWIRGLPTPELEADVRLNDQGYAQQILQQGWQVDYLKYRNESSGYMPVRIKATNGDVRMTLVVRTWKLQ